MVNPRLLIVSFNFPPHPGAGTYRILNLTKHLARMGWEISVLTVDERYYGPGVLLDHDLIKRIPNTLSVYQTRVFRGLSLIFHIRDLFLRPFNRWRRDQVARGLNREGCRAITGFQRFKDAFTVFWTMPDDEAGWLPFAVLKGRKIIKKQGIDVLLTTAPPFTSHLIGYCLKKLTGAKWVADFRDPWSRAPWAAQFMNSTFRGRLHKVLEGMVVGLADQVILNTDQLTREFCHHYGPDFVPRFNLLTNGYDPEDLEGIEIGKRNQTSKKLVITHTGTFYKQRDPSCFIQALGELAARGLITKESMEVNLVGRFTMSGTSPERLIAQYPLEGILNIIPPVSHRESLMFLARSDVLLLIQPATNLQVPAKLFEYMLFRKPILGLTSGGAVDEIIKGGRLGIVVRADDILEIQRAILRFYERPFPGFDPDETFLNKFHIHRLAERLDQILKVAIGRPCEGILKGDRNILWR